MIERQWEVHNAAQLLSCSRKKNRAKYDHCLRAELGAFEAFPGRFCWPHLAAYGLANDDIMSQVQQGQRPSHCLSTSLEGPTGLPRAPFVILREVHVCTLIFVFFSFIQKKSGKFKKNLKPSSKLFTRRSNTGNVTFLEMCDQ